MPTADLARSRTTDETITPMFIDPDEERYRKTGRELIQLFEEHLGESKGDLEDAIDEMLVSQLLTDAHQPSNIEKIVTNCWRAMYRF